MAVAPHERAGPFELVVLLPADQPHQLLLALLQGRHQAVEMAGQLFSLLLSVLLRPEGQISPGLTRLLPSGSPLWRGTSPPSGRCAPGCGRYWRPARRSRRSAPSVNAKHTHTLFSAEVRHPECTWAAIVALMRCRPLKPFLCERRVNQRWRGRRRRPSQLLRKQPDAANSLTKLPAVHTCGGIT